MENETNSEQTASTTEELQVEANGEKVPSKDTEKSIPPEPVTTPKPAKTPEPVATPESSDGWMSGKVLAILIASYVLFIILGGVIFHFIEYSTEQIAVTGSSNKIASFLENNTCVSTEEMKQLIKDIIKAYDQGITASNDTDSHNTNWDIISSTFFSTTIVTTIGYGNMSPATAGGRVFAVFYALLGIPLFIITSGQLGMRMSKLSEKLAAKVLKKVSKEKWKKILSLILVSTVGFTVFSLCAAIMFTYVEGWSYNESMYYTFITLTTIGFGDYYPGFANGGTGDSIGVGFYRVFVSLWIIFGLVWMATTLSAISDAVGSMLNSRNVSHGDDNKEEELKGKEENTEL